MSPTKITVQLGGYYENTVLKTSTSSISVLLLFPEVTIDSQAELAPLPWLVPSSHSFCLLTVQHPRYSHSLQTPQSQAPLITQNSAWCLGSLYQIFLNKQITKFSPACLEYLPESSWEKECYEGQHFITFTQQSILPEFAWGICTQ